jgi:hypothetical protein
MIMATYLLIKKGEVVIKKGEVVIKKGEVYGNDSLLINTTY